ncbi:MAG: hypothetical protein FWD01_04205, partial [Defluviitaleaceae bacterium]|nr:hypothetical protein [Defluviitaleaceae bacterium]
MRIKLPMIAIFAIPAIMSIFIFSSCGSEPARPQGVVDAEITEPSPLGSRALQLIGGSWDNVAFASYVFDDMVADGIDHKTLGLILVEDLLEFLDDYVAFEGEFLAIFEDLWYLFTAPWSDWM